MYAFLLGFALVSVVASAVLVLLLKLPRFRGSDRKRWLSIFGGITSFLGMVASVLAGILHFIGEHNQSSANPMKPAMFFAEHPAVLVLSALAIILSILHARS